MSGAGLRVQLDSTFSNDQVLQIRAYLASEDDVVVRSENRTLGVLPEIMAAAPAVGAVVALANLLLNIYVRIGNYVLDIEEVIFYKPMPPKLADIRYIWWSLR